jgi:hypothetical protein
MKKMLLPMLVLAAGIAFSAFTVSNHESKKVDGQMWYEFVGTDVNSPSDYSLLGDGTQAPSCDANTTIRCAVLAEEGTSGHPDLSDPNIEIRNKVQ